LEIMSALDYMMIAEGSYNFMNTLSFRIDRASPDHAAASGEASGNGAAAGGLRRSPAKG
jgi:hypothetical protein